MECNQVCQIGYSHRKIKKSGLKVARLFFFLKLKLTLLHVLPCVASGLSFVLEDSGKFGIATGGRV